MSSLGVVALSLSWRAILGTAGDVPSKCPAFEEEMMDSDMSGTLLWQVQAADSTECCSHCDSADGCEGFAYAHGTCFLKKDFGGFYENPGVVSRVRSLGTCSDFGEAKEGQDLAGRLLGSWEGNTSELCCQACGRTAGCDGFVYFEKRCFLKADVTGVYDSPGRTARVKEMPSSPGPAAEPSCSAFDAEYANVDLSGTLISEQAVLHRDECCTICDALEGCEGYAHVNGTCFFKKGLAGTYENPGVVSQLRSSGQCSDYSVEDGKDLAGRTLEAWGSPTTELCCQACGRKAGCQGFVFSDKVCYLKADVTGVYDSPGRVTHVKEGVLAPSGEQGANRRLRASPSPSPSYYPSPSPSPSYR